MSRSKIKITTIFTLLLFSLALQAQGKTQAQKDKMKREKEIMSFISGDQYLLDHYNSGKHTLNAGRAIGVISIGFLSGILFSEKNITQLGFVLFNIVAAPIFGVTGFVLCRKGKSKIRDVENYVRGEIGYGETKLNLEITDNGVGLVYHF